MEHEPIADQQQNCSVDGVMKIIVGDSQLSPFERRVERGFDVIEDVASKFLTVYRLPFWLLGYLSELFHVPRKGAEHTKDHTR